jgi:hypothetical protein
MQLSRWMTSVATAIIASLSFTAAGQSGPPPPQSLENITSCSLEGSDVFIGTGRGAAARRYKYGWDALIDALCNAKGFAIASPAKAAATAVAASSPPTAAPTTPAMPTASAAATSGTPDSLGFPPGATRLEPAQLTQLVSGRTGRIVEGRDIGSRTQYDANGVVYYNGNGINLSGRWRVEGSMLCYEWNRQQAATGCNEVRMVGDRMYFKRVSGEIVRMEMAR